MAVSQSDIDDAYADGQRDGSRNSYSPPGGILKAGLGVLSKDEMALREAYDKGYDHGRSNR